MNFLHTFLLLIHPNGYLSQLPLVSITPMSLENSKSAFVCCSDELRGWVCNNSSKSKNCVSTSPYSSSDSTMGSNVYSQVARFFLFFYGKTSNLNIVHFRPRKISFIIQSSGEKREGKKKKAVAASFAFARFRQIRWENLKEEKCLIYFQKSEQWLLGTRQETPIYYMEQLGSKLRLQYGYAKRNNTF